jgi:hypothetical protein
MVHLSRRNFILTLISLILYNCTKCDKEYNINDNDDRDDDDHDDDDSIFGNKNNNVYLERGKLIHFGFVKMF